MDDKILTPGQKLRVLGIRLLKKLPADEHIAEGKSAADVIRSELNWEFEVNGLEGVRLVESQVDDD